MDMLVNDYLLQLLTIGITFSIILMTLIQKFKDLSFITQGWQTWLLNLICSFALGIPFGMTFYALDFSSSIWVGVFGFIGAPTLYEALKSQNIINYTPKATGESNDNITITNAEEIKRS